jgi:hypothetical protein
MAFEFFSYDPLTGVKTLFDYDEEKDLAIFRREEDVSGLLKVAAETRARGPTSYLNTDDEQWWPQAMIPATVMAELLKKGIDVAAMEGRDATRLAQEIEQNYPALKLTDKKIYVPPTRKKP